MKLQILSDLHLEFAPFEPPKTNADVIILAGDTHIGTKGIEWAKQYFPEKPVLYILGNHEYYTKAYPKLPTDLRNLTRDSNIHILENDAIQIGDTVFLGCTLWTDFALFGNAKLAGLLAMQTMTDYKKIRVSPQFSKLRSIDTTIIHQKSMRFLEEQFLEQQGKKLVVISHHAPSQRSIPLEFQTDVLSAAYASSLDTLVENSGAALWIHGHLHQAQDYLLGNTRVICNPRGYPDELGTGFSECLTIKI
jgi:predicted phosphodiesterase